MTWRNVSSSNRMATPVARMVQIIPSPPRRPASIRRLIPFNSSGIGKSIGSQILLTFELIAIHPGRIPRLIDPRRNRPINECCCRGQSGVWHCGVGYGVLTQPSFIVVRNREQCPGGHNPAHTGVSLLAGCSLHYKRSGISLQGPCVECLATGHRGERLSPCHAGDLP